VPGFQDAFEDKAVKDLLTIFSDKISSLKEKYQHLEERIVITITSTATSGTWSVPHTFYVKENDKVSSLLLEVQTKYGPPGDGKRICLTKTSSYTKLRVDSNLTFSENGINSGGKTTLYVWGFLIANAW